MIGGPCYLMMSAMNGRWCYNHLSPNKDNVAFWVKHSSIKWQERLEEMREGQANRSPGFTGNTVVGPPIHGCCWGCDLSQWSSVLGQGSASGYDQLFKRFFWLSCPFSTMNAHCKAPADALNVVTDYSWLTNRQAGSAPINPARFTSMLLQGDSNRALMAGWEEQMVQDRRKTNESHQATSLTGNSALLLSDWKSRSLWLQPEINIYHFLTNGIDDFF